MPEAVTNAIPKALDLLDSEAFQKIYGEEERTVVADLADVYAGAWAASSWTSCAGTWLESP